MSFAEKLKARLNQLENAALSKIADVADEELAEKRMDICRQCPFYLSMTHQCKKCGCIMNLKTKIRDAKCPIGKW